MAYDANVFNHDALIYSKAEIADTLEGVHGNRIIGTLDEELISMYVRLANAELELDDLSSEITKRFVERSMNVALDALNGATLGDFYQRIAQNGWYEDEAEAAMILERVARWQQLHATFWYDVRSMFKVWNEWLEVRSEFRLVSIGKKFEKPA